MDVRTGGRPVGRMWRLGDEVTFVYLDAHVRSGGAPLGFTLPATATPVVTSGLHGALDIRLVGSVARGEQTHASDIDFLVRFAPGRSLFDQAGLIHDLEELLGVDVDVISEGGLRPTDTGLRNDAIAL